jgi:phosphatidylinositol phosphate synthase
VIDLAFTSTGLAASLTLFVLFLIGRGGSSLHERPTRRRGRGAALPRLVLDFGDWLLAPFIPMFRRCRISPNALSLLSLPVSASASIAVATGHFGLGGSFLWLAFSLDAWDGLLARTTETASDAGEVVDATVDRYNDVIVMLGFLYYYRDDALPWLLTSLALLGTVVVSYTRAKGEAFGVVADLGFMQRHERAVWLSLATTVAPAIAVLLGEKTPPRYYAVIVVMGVVAFGTNVTAVRRARFVIARLTDR